MLLDIIHLVHSSPLLGLWSHIICHVTTVTYLFIINKKKEKNIKSRKINKKKRKMLVSKHTIIETVKPSYYIEMCFLTYIPSTNNITNLFTKLSFQDITQKFVGHLGLTIDEKSVPVQRKCWSWANRLVMIYSFYFWLGIPFIVIGECWPYSILILFHHDLSTA